MKVNYVRPYAKMLGMDQDASLAMLRKIESIGRVSHRSEEKQTEDSWKRFIPAVVLDHGDWSITEHASVSVEFLVDRGITHEIVRHRIASYTQESTRFVNYLKWADELKFISPQESKLRKEVINEYIESAAQKYEASLRAGDAPQIARALLPTCTASKLVMTCNLRNWRNFLIKRTTKETHPQCREVTIPLLAEFQARIPFLYNDIVPNERQAVALRKAM